MTGSRLPISSALMTPPLLSILAFGLAPLTIVVVWSFWTFGHPVDLWPEVLGWGCGGGGGVEARGLG